MIETATPDRCRSLREAAAAAYRLMPRLRSVHGLAVLVGLTVALTALIARPAPAAANEAAWAALRKPGHVALMRHSLAPGFGDPAGWRLDSCATQRNLSEAGRAQARRVGSQLEARQLRFDLVLSSAWCRCIETAQHVTGRAPEVFAGLNSFFEDASTRPRQIADTRAKLAALPPETRVLMVTHQVVISALTGRTASSGEVIVAKRRADGSLTAVGAIMIE